MANAVGWFEIYVQDMARARAFYGTVLQRRLERLDGPGIEMWAFVGVRGRHGRARHQRRAGPCAGEGFRGEQHGRLLQPSDCAIEAARVPGAGGSIRKEKFAIGPYGFVALAHDPDGNLIGLHSLA